MILITIIITLHSRLSFYFSSTDFYDGVLKIRVVLTPFFGQHVLKETLCHLTAFNQPTNRNAWRCHQFCCPLCHYSLAFFSEILSRQVNFSEEFRGSFCLEENIYYKKEQLEVQLLQAPIYMMAVQHKIAFMLLLFRENITIML